MWPALLSMAQEFSGVGKAPYHLPLVQVWMDVEMFVFSIPAAVVGSILFLLLGFIWGRRRERRRRARQIAEGLSIY